MTKHRNKSTVDRTSDRQRGPYTMYIRSPVKNGVFAVLFLWAVQALQDTHIARTDGCTKVDGKNVAEL